MNGMPPHFIDIFHVLTFLKKFQKSGQKVQYDIFKILLSY